MSHTAGYKTTRIGQRTFGKPGDVVQGKCGNVIAAECTIIVDIGNIVARDCTIIGNRNKIRCSGCKITGNQNEVRILKTETPVLTTVTGNDNIVLISACEVIGNGNTVRTDKSLVKGDDNDIYANGCKVIGHNNRDHGEDNDLRLPGEQPLRRRKREAEPSEREVRAETRAAKKKKETRDSKKKDVVCEDMQPEELPEDKVEALGDRVCKICFARELDCTFLHADGRGHRFMCTHCLQEHLRERPGTCFCNEKFEKVIHYRDVAV